MVLGVIFVILFSVLFITTFFSIKKSFENDTIIELEALEHRFNKALEKVTLDEWNLYKKIWSKIYHKNPKFWNIKENMNSFGEYIKEIKIDRLCIKMEKVKKKYECIGLEIQSDNEEISFNPPKEQLEIYDMFCELALHLLEKYYNQLEKDEQKEVSKEHQANVKLALKKWTI